MVTMVNCTLTHLHKIECNFLSEDAKPDSQTNAVQNIIEQLFEDLNSYCECQIPISKYNMIWERK